MSYTPPFPYSAADYRAREMGLAVLGSHYCVMPPGVPLRDHWGNYIQAEMIWIGAVDLGRDAIGSSQAAYGVVVQSIHNQAMPDLGSVLANIRRALLTVEEFPQRADYVQAMLPYHHGDPKTLADAWTWELDCALRARKTLPPALIDWLLSLKCSRY